MTSDRIDIASRIAASRLQPARKSEAPRPQQPGSTESFSRILAELEKARHGSGADEAEPSSSWKVSGHFLQTLALAVEEARRTRETVDRTIRRIVVGPQADRSQVLRGVQRADEAFQMLSAVRARLLDVFQELSSTDEESSAGSISVLRTHLDSAEPTRSLTEARRSLALKEYSESQWSSDE